MNRRSTSARSRSSACFGLVVGVLATMPAAEVRAASFEHAYVLSPPSSGSETNVALDARGEDLLYGARAEDEPGAAALYLGLTGSLQLTLNAPDPEQAVEDKFGSAVALSARRIVVSAPQREKVYVFDRAGGLEATLAPPGSPGNPPAAVATRGALVVVGAPFASDDGPGAGAAYLFDARDGDLIRTLLGPGAGSNFGWAVATNGRQVFVGAPGEIPNAGLAGSVTAFDTRTGAELWSIQSPQPSSGDRFGAVLAIGAGGLLVGAPYADLFGTDTGAAFLVRGNGSIARTYRNPSGSADKFGSAVGAGGGVVVVGAPDADALETDAGAAYVFRRNARLLQTLVPDPTTFCAGAGGAVAVGRDFVAVGVRDCFGKAATHVYTR